MQLCRVSTIQAAAPTHRAPLSLYVLHILAHAHINTISQCQKRIHGSAHQIWQLHDVITVNGLCGCTGSFEPTAMFPNVASNTRANFIMYHRKWANFRTQTHTRPSKWNMLGACEFKQCHSFEDRQTVQPFCSRPSCKNANERIFSSLRKESKRPHNSWEQKLLAK